MLVPIALQISQVINLATKDAGRTALHCAVLSGSPQANFIYSLLLTVGANPAATDLSGDTALLMAVKKGGMLETAKFLAHSGSCLRQQGRHVTPFVQGWTSTYATERASRPCKSPHQLGSTMCSMSCSRLVGRPTVPVRPKVRTCTLSSLGRAHLRTGVLAPIHAAARQGHVACVRLLLQAGVSADALSSTGARPLHYACFGGHAGVVETLLEFGADVNAPDATGQTPLAMVALKGAIELAPLIISRGANPNVCTDKTLMTPLHLAAQHGYGAMIAYLASINGIEINAQDSQKRTALHWLVFLGDMASVASLLEHGADPLKPDGNGHSAVEVAVAKGYKEIAELLIARCGLLRSFGTVGGSSACRTGSVAAAKAAENRGAVELLG